MENPHPLLIVEVSQKTEYWKGLRNLDKAIQHLLYQISLILRKKLYMLNLGAEWNWKIVSP